MYRIKSDMYERGKKSQNKGKHYTLSDRARNSSPNECTVWYPLNADKRESNFIMDVISKSPTGNQEKLVVLCIEKGPLNLVAHIICDYMRERIFL